MRTPDENRLAQIAYDTAYFEVPKAAHSSIAEFRSEFEESPELGAMRIFLRAAKFRGTKPDVEDVRRLRAHLGKLETGWDYIVIEYPRVAAVDLLKDFRGDLPLSASSHVLAPYFSAVLEDRSSGEVRCYVLGQSPDAQTTLRVVSPEMNANLGRGCEPELDAFLELLRQRTTG
jgi:hypothetical protein